MSNLPPNCCLKVDLQKSGQTNRRQLTPNTARTISCKAWNSLVKYPNWVARCDIKGSDGTMLNPIFWKKVQGQKHLGRWEIAECKIPSVKMFFKTNTKCHKHPSISYETGHITRETMCLVLDKMFVVMWNQTNEISHSQVYNWNWVCLNYYFMYSLDTRGGGAKLVLPYSHHSGSFCHNEKSSNELAALSTPVHIWVVTDRPLFVLINYSPWCIKGITEENPD